MSCISCCVSPLGPRKRRTTPQHPILRLVLTYLKPSTGLNRGYDDVHKDYKVFDIDPIRDEVLDFDTVKANFENLFDH